MLSLDLIIVTTDADVKSQVASVIFKLPDVLLTLIDF